MKYNKNDIVTFRVGKEELVYRVVYIPSAHENREYYLELKDDTLANDKIFDKLEITNPYAFCLNAGCNNDAEGIFPWMNLESINIIIPILQKLCRQKNSTTRVKISLI